MVGDRLMKELQLNFMAFDGEDLLFRKDSLLLVVTLILELEIYRKSET